MSPIDAAAAEHARAYDLHCQGRLDEAAVLYRTALSLDPGLAEGWINLGLIALDRQRPEEAMLCQRRALVLAPEHAGALNSLGMAHYAAGHVPEAEACFRAALRLAPEDPNAMLNLGSARQVAGQPAEAEALFRQALRLGVDPVRAKGNLALALLDQARPEDAAAHGRDALAMDPGSASARVNHALALLTLGRLEEAWPDYEARWSVTTMADPLPVTGRPRWSGQPLDGQTVLVYAEQGFGDVIQFCRYVPMLAAAGGRVVLVVPRALRRLMRGLDGVATLLTEADGPLPHFDYHCPLMGLPLGFGTTLATVPGAVPYLRADPRDWRDVLDGMAGLKVGLVWAGKARTAQPQAVAIDRRRSMRLATLAPLLDVAGCAFVSLQLGPPAGQAAGQPGLRDVAGRLDDWADTAGLIAGLDLVIAVDTAVAHLAGALGRPVWLLNRYDSCWRWMLDRPDSPWYPSMRIFRQRRPGDWDEVIARVRAALADLAADRSAAPVCGAGDIGTDDHTAVTGAAG